jgi:hypothetical protein
MAKARKGEGARNGERARDVAQWQRGARTPKFSSGLSLEH